MVRHQNVAPAETVSSRSLLAKLNEGGMDLRAREKCPSRLRATGNEVDWVCDMNLLQATQPFHTSLRRSQTAARQSVNLAGGVARAEAVVNIHHGHAAAATVQHAKQRRKPGKAGSVADAGRHGDDRFGNQSGDQTRQRSYNASDHAK